MKMKRPRDSQRAKVYRAEQEAFGSLPLDHKARRTYRDMDELRARIDAIWQSSTVGKMITHKSSQARPRAVKDGRGMRAGRATAGSYELTFTVDARKEWIVMHEMAHTVHQNAISGYETAQQAWHGHEFCAIYLKLVRRFIGKDAHDALRACFKKYRVRYTPPRKLSPERLAQLREHGRRLAASINNTGERK